MAKLIPKCKTITKDCLFYNQFEYAVGFYLNEANSLRTLDHEAIDMIIARRKTWREVAQERWSKLSRSSNATILTFRHREITNKTVDNLHAFAEVLLTSGVDYKLVVSVNQGWVYSNDISLLAEIGGLDYITHISYTRAKITRPKNTIQLKNPKFQYRSYLKRTKLTPQEKEVLVRFLVSQQPMVRIAPSLLLWSTSAFNRTQDYFFVDHSTESWLSMINLVLPGIIRKTQQIIPAK